MHTCAVCDAPLGTADDTVRCGVVNYHVHSYTCETVLRERFIPATAPTTTQRRP